MMLYLAIATWFAFVITSAIFHQYFKRKAANDFDRHYTQAVDESFAAMIKSLDGVEQSVANKLATEMRMRDPRPTTRVYTFLLKRGTETRMVVQPADTFEHMVEQTNRELGLGWLVTASAFVDVLPPVASKMVMDEKLAPKTEAKPKQQGNFIHSLEYARDVFARTEPQKKVLDDIIKRIKQVEYGKSTTASGN